MVIQLVDGLDDRRQCWSAVQRCSTDEQWPAVQGGSQCMQTFPGCENLHVHSKVTDFILITAKYYH